MVSAKPSTPVLNTVDPNFVGLLMALPLSDGSGVTATDLSGNGHSGALNGVATWFNDPTLGTVLQLDGTSGYVALDNAINGILAIQTTATVAFWLRLRNATPATQQKAGLATIQAMTGAGAATLYPNPSDAQGYFSVFRTNIRVNAVPLGGTDRSQWHHLAITQVSNSFYKVYINGTLISSTVAEFGVGAMVSPPTLGRSTDTGGNYFLDGYIGDFRVWTRVLTAPEILTLVNNPWALYTFSAQQAQMRMLSTHTEATLDPPAAIRELAMQTEVDIRPAANVASTVIMVDAQIATTFPYAITDGQDPRYKPTTPTLVADAITSGLTLAIPFSEGAGATAADQSGGAANGTLNGATWQADATSPFFKPTKPTLVKAPDVAFPLNTNSVTVPAGAAVEPTTNFTLAAWVVVGPNTGTNMVIMSKVNDPNGAVPNTGATWSYIFWQGSDQKFRLEISDNIDSSPPDVVIGVNTYTNGTLCHVVATYDGVFLRIYVNGVFEAQQANSGTVPYNSNGTHALHIGNDELSGGQWRWPGRIEDVRIWNRALSQTEITQIYTGTFGIYCNFALMRTLDLQAEACLDPPAAVRLLQTQVDADIYPSVYVQSTILMVDATPAVHNTNFGVLSISPILGPLAGGTAVTIGGFNFSGVTSVLVGGVPLSSLAVPNSSTITGVTGAHTQGLVDVQVITSGFGNLVLPQAFAYVPGFTPQALLGLVGAQLDSSLIQTNVYTGETAPLGADTTLSFTLPDVPVSPACLELTVRKVAQPGGVWMRQGPIYDYSVDMANKKIIWRGSTAAFALAPGDEITVRALYQGN